jgi:CHAT domain-containing protein
MAPNSLLSLLPLHILELPGKDGLRLIDLFEVVYVVDLRRYLEKREDQIKPDPQLLLISDPESVLTHAEYERQALTELIPNHQLLCGDQASCSAVFGRLTGGDEFNFIHFTTHGTYGWNYFDDGGLKLANGETLPFRSIIESVKMHSDPTVVLAACESGITDFEEVPNETFGLQLAFLNVGARAVISSLWPVDDRATAYLMRSFYEGIQRGLAPTAALRHAQLWLRDTTTEELSSDQMPQTNQTRISIQEAEIKTEEPNRDHNKPFSDPIYWA